MKNGNGKLAVDHSVKDRIATAKKMTSTKGGGHDDGARGKAGSPGKPSGITFGPRKGGRS